MINKKDWIGLSVLSKVELFKHKYVEALRKNDLDFIHMIKTHIKYEYAVKESDIILEENKIIHFREISLEDFAQKYITYCDEEFKVIPHFVLITDEEKKERIHRNKDFIISYNLDYSKEDIISLTGERSIYSHEFGPWANFKDEDIQDDFFKCSCGKTKGKYNLGVICPEPGCNTPVKEMDYSIDKFGYFETPVKFLTYKGYQLLNRILSGNKKSDGILDLLCSVKLPKNIVDNKGKLKYKESDLALVKRYKNTYLYDSVEDLIQEVAGDKETKAKDIAFFLENKNALFTNYIPVISTAFRRFNASKTFEIDKIETFNSLNQLYVELSTALKDFDLFKGTNFACRNYFLVTKIVKKIGVAIHEIATEAKEKYLRANVMGLRQNNVVMAVLEPLNTGLKEDLCVINYNALKALFSMRIEEWLINKAYRYHDIQELLNLNKEPSSEEKLILEEFVATNTLIVEFNRQPTIALQSSLPILIAGLTDAKVIYMHPLTCGKVASDHDKISVTFIGITYRCLNTVNCWNALKPISPAGSRKSEEKYIG